jgi:mannobiose 2-epimerase
MTELAEELKVYREIFSNELDNILSYWISRGVEKEGQGFYGAVDLDGVPDLAANKTSVLNARILWTFSAAAMMYDKKEYAEIADRAYRVVNEDFADGQFGGYFMELTSGNRVANDIKHTYAQAFVIYALCKYYEFRKLETTKETIKNFFHLLEEKAKDKLHPGYLEAFTRDWNLYNENRMADNNEPKSMNTHLHVLEAYTALYRVLKDDLAGIRLTELIDLFLDKIIRSDGHFGIFYDNGFNESAASTGTCSFGHDIEGSWLLPEAAEVLGDPVVIERIKKTSIRMVDAVDRVGVDKDGGLFLESVRYGSHVRTNKHWWLQAETLVGFMNAFQMTGNTRYWETVKLTWNFIDNYVIDHERGEWYTKVSRLGVPFLTEPPDDPSPYYRNDRKIDPWKCPYHNGRAMMELMKRIDEMLKPWF